MAVSHEVDMMVVCQTVDLAAQSEVVMAVSHDAESAVGDETNYQPFQNNFVDRLVDNIDDLGVIDTDDKMSNQNE